MAWLQFQKPCWKATGIHQSSNKLVRFYREIQFQKTDFDKPLLETASLHIKEEEEEEKEKSPEKLPPGK